MDPIEFATSAFPPLALGFFGLGTGYLIYGPQELFGFPKRDESVDRAMGIWGIWLPGFCQFVAGTMLFLIRVDFQLAQIGTLRSLDSDQAGHRTAATSRRGTKAISSKRRLKRHEASAR